MHPDCSSALCPFTHLHKNIPIPTFLSVLERDNDGSSAESVDFSQTSKSSASIVSMLSDEKPHSSQAADIPQLFNLNDVNDLVRDLGLTKGKLELISSKWKQWNILQKGVNCTYIRFRHANLQDSFSAQNNECY